MKRVLITGANSFLGDNVKKYLEDAGKYQVDILDMLDEKWRLVDFSIYDVVFNVCAIVHRHKEKNKDLYFKVNRDLALEIANKAKAAGVKQFIQTSTNGVFGIEVGVMSVDKGFNPKTPYEKSKYEADCLLESLRDGNFKVCIIRPPLMYGNDCKGNFPRLEKFAIKYPIFPSVKNKKDFLYIKNMADFVKFAIDNSLDEVCYPRDIEPVSVANMVKLIAEKNGKKIHLWGLLNPLVKFLSKCSHSFRLVFGDCYCTEPISSKEWTSSISFEDAIAEMYVIKTKQ